MERIDVTCAVIIKEGQILVCQRGADSEHPFEWEFPGGKIEPGETAEECIVREIKEELSVDILVKRALKYIEHYYPAKYIRLIPFLCEITRGNLTPLEHEQIKWIAIDEFALLDWSEADKSVYAINREQISSEPD